MHIDRDKHTQMLPKSNRRRMQLDKHFILATFRSCYHHNVTGLELSHFFQLKIFNASESFLKQLHFLHTEKKKDGFL